MIKLPFRRPVVALSVTAGLVVILTACGSDNSSDTSSAGSSSVPAPASSAPASSAPAAGAKPLSFSLVEELTAPRLTKDPNCLQGKWGTNSTGVEEEFRPKSTFFRQFDCYKTNNPDVLFPTRGQQSIYVEFSDAQTAKAYADDQAVLYKTLVDDKKVVVAGTGLDTVDMDAYLADIKNACGCGTVIEP